jgi:hypothetical protein
VNDLVDLIEEHHDVVRYSASIEKAFPERAGWRQRQSSEESTSRAWFNDVFHGIPSVLAKSSTVSPSAS